MAKSSSVHMKFAQCAVGSKARVWFVAEEQDDFRLLQLKDAAKWAARTPEWPIGSLCGIDSGDGRCEVLALGIDGELLIGTPRTFSESHIDPKTKGPDQFGVMRDIRWVGKDVFAVGMSRQAYRRSGGHWSDVAGQIRKQGGGAIGFNSVHGLSPQAVFAVGFGGEIWLYNGATWNQLDSPTSIALNRVLVLPSGQAVMCGASGVVLHGAPDALTHVQNDVTEDNLYGLSFFRGRVYVSSLKTLYVIGDKGLEHVDVGIKGPLTFGSLDATDDVIWSAGSRHLLCSNDGVKWEQVFCKI